jgi:NAD(P)-dependent dehydrogenase (short-subunit alcohol dehydrogenase family)
MLIEGGVFVVTGAGSGLGAATASMLVAQGGRVVIADMNESRGVALARELGDAACFVPTDVSDETSAEVAIAAAQAVGPLRGLVNCAGIAPAQKVVGKAAPHLLSDFTRTIAVNLVGTFNMIRLAADVMARNERDSGGERGVIICTASVAAFDGQIGQAAYSASKGGVVAMTLPIARELSRFGIRVMTIAPGIMETPMLLGMPSEVQEALSKSVPFPSRMGRPSEYADLVRHIVQNAYLNGEIIRLDGAIRMPAK